MKKSIGLKLFMIMMTTIIVIASIQLFVQSTLFEQYYEITKQKKLEAQMKKYEKLLSNHSSELEEFVLNELHNGRLIASSSWMGTEVLGFDMSDIVNVITVKSDSKSTYRVSANFDSLEVNFPVGSYIEVEGVPHQGKAYELDGMVFITEDSRSFYSGTLSSPISATVTPVEGEGSIDGIQLEPVKITGEVMAVESTFDRNALYLKEVAGEYIFSMVQNLFSSSDAFKTIDQNLTTGDIDLQVNQNLLVQLEDSEEIVNSGNLSNLVQIKKYNDNTMIIGVTTITPIKEILTLLNQFYALIYGVLILLSIVVAYLFSISIKKPIIEMTKYAHHIANQNFDSTINSNRRDELGELADSLALIAMNLQEKILTLEDANRQLQEEVLVQEQLKRKEKELVANVSHELKTPLTVMKGYIRGIENGIYKKEDIKVMDKLMTEVDEMSEMVVSLLSLFKLQTQQEVNKQTIINIWEPILSCYDKVHMAFEERGLNFIYNYDEEQFVLGDRKMMEQLFNNLLLNAMKYAKPYTDIIVITEQVNERLKVTIENESDDLKKEDISQLWEPFYRPDKSRTKDTGGTGLGLSIIKEILENHGSGYSLDYEGGKFKITFDLERVKRLKG